MLKKINLLGVGITNEGEENILEYLFERLKSHQKKLFITTPNPEILVYATKHTDYKDKLNSADISLPDGIGVFLASGLLGNQLKERIPGVDFMEKICEKLNGQPVSIGLLGGRKGIAEMTARCLKKKYPELKIVFAKEEWPDKPQERKSEKEKERKSEKENRNINSPLHPFAFAPFRQPIDILFVAFGFPKQEEWIWENLEKLPVKAAMGVGGAFDYISGTLQRAPYMIRASGFEWLYRLIRQPWRIRRQLALGEFVFLVAKELIKKRI